MCSPNFTVATEIGYNGSMKTMKLHSIIIGKKAKEALQSVTKAEAVRGLGLKGDRYYYGRGTFNKAQLSQNVREISILPYETLEVCNRRLGTSLAFTDLRRNLVIEGFDIDVLDGHDFAIGTAVFRIVRTAPPCRYLSRLLGEDMMSGLKHIGGYRAVIVRSGTIKVGDEIVLL